MNLTTQGDFLRFLGIETRLQMLLQNASPQQGETLKQSVHRLIHPEEMGTTYKVFSFLKKEYGPPVWPVAENSKQ